VTVAPQLTVPEREVDIVLLEVLFDCPERVVVLDFEQESWDEGEKFSREDILLGNIRHSCDFISLLGGETNEGGGVLGKL